MCLSAIYWAHIAKVFYANDRHDAARINFDDAMIYKEIVKENEKKQISMIQIMREEALAVFDLWERKENKILY